jgi:thiol-disulfide isomerase/thioredoxin
MMKHFQILIFFLCTTFGFAQFTISGTFAPAEDFTYAFLYKSSPDGASYIDRAQTDAEGNFSIALDSTATPGMYKIVYAIPPEENNFDIIVNTQEDIHFNFSFDDGISFTTSKENKLWANYVNAIQEVNITISNFYQSENKNKSEYQAIFKSLKETHNAFLEDANGLLATAFIEANEPYFPKDFEDATTYSNHLKENYLKHVDFSSELLQSSDFLTDRVNAYMFDMVDKPNTDDYKQLLFEVNELIGHNAHFKSIVYTNIWQRFVTNNQTEMAVYITDRYLLDIAEKEKNEPLKDALLAYKNTTIGAKAVDFEIPLRQTSLHNLNSAQKYVLIFWSSSCSHCLKELPVVKSMLENQPDIQVVAIGLEEDLEQWESERQKYPEFMHAIQLNKWDGELVKAYNIRSTPTLFLLDANKIIIEKPNDAEALKEILGL